MFCILKDGQLNPIFVPRIQLKVKSRVGVCWKNHTYIYHLLFQQLQQFLCFGQYYSFCYLGNVPLEMTFSQVPMMQLIFQLLAIWNAAGFQVEGKVKDRQLPYVKLIIIIGKKGQNTKLLRNIHSFSLSFAKTTFQDQFGLRNITYFSIRKAQWLCHHRWQICMCTGM